mmetsp:Transcript_14843/g.43587  ORF Transcript_14843/g.43587 Transcript_14843/m.43587 type:complete len:281 (+) Transcript_14843:1096-1938(+)
MLPRTQRRAMPSCSTASFPTRRWTRRRCTPAAPSSRASSGVRPCGSTLMSSSRTRRPACSRTRPSMLSRMSRGGVKTWTRGAAAGQAPASASTTPATWWMALGRAAQAAAHVRRAARPTGGASERTAPRAATWTCSERRWSGWASTGGWTDGAGDAGALTRRLPRCKLRRALVTGACRQTRGAVGGSSTLSGASWPPHWSCTATSLSRPPQAPRPCTSLPTWPTLRDPQVRDIRPDRGATPGARHAHKNEHPVIDAFALLSLQLLGVQLLSLLYDYCYHC